MKNEKPITPPLAIHFKLTKELCPKTQEEIEYMSKFPYSSTVGSLMYSMVLTIPDITNIVGAMRMYMNHTGKDH